MPSQFHLRYAETLLQNELDAKKSVTAGVENKRDERTLRNLRRMNTHNFDRIFQSLTDLAYFLEFGRNNPSFAKLLDDEIRDLSGSRDKKEKYVPGPLERILSALFIADIGIKGTEDFRTTLAYSVLKIAGQKIVESVEEDLQKVARPKFQEVEAWAKIVSDRIIDDNETRKREMDYAEPEHEMSLVSKIKRMQSRPA